MLHFNYNLKQIVLISFRASKNSLNYVFVVIKFEISHPEDSLNREI